MKRKIRLHSMLSLMVVTFWAGAGLGVSSSQSLGDVARKERERRKANKEEGVAAKEFSDEEIFGPDAGEENETSEASESGVVGSEEEIDEPAAVTGDPDRGARERRRSEAEWRARFQRARSRVAEAREYKQSLEGLRLASGERYVDAHGNTVVHSLEHLQRLVREADEELAAAEQSLVDLREEARRAGVPPGWLR